MSCNTDPYNGCKYSKKMVEKLIRHFNIKNFIEAGTFKGITTRDVASNFPDILIQTVEIIPNVYSETKKTFSSFNNIKAFLSDSKTFLQNIGLNEGATLYYLDAHWGDQHPLHDELKIISERSLGNEIIVIDDFQVPNRGFSYDYTDRGQAYCMDWIDGILDKNIWSYFYKSEQDHPTMMASGQVIFYHKNLDLSMFIKYENGIPYSNNF